MITNCILIFDGVDETIYTDNLLTFDGEHDFTTLASLEAKVDTREFTLTFLGDTFPNIRKLRLNNSIIPSVRDIGCTLVNLRFLSLARCNISSLDGIATLSQNLEELYLAFNQITDVIDLMGMNKLKIIDLEDNKIEQLNSIEILTFCEGLRALTLQGNPAAEELDYRQKVATILPQLVYLDEKRLKAKTVQKGDQTPKCPAPLPPENTNSINSCQPAKSLLNSFSNSSDKAPETVVKPRVLTMGPLSIDDIDDETNDTTSKIIQGQIKSEKVVTFSEVPDIGIEQRLPEENEHIITEQVEDLVEDRPPTTRGFYSNSPFKDFGKTQTQTQNKQQTKKNKNVFSTSMPRIVRPMSAKGRPF